MEILENIKDLHVDDFYHVIHSIKLDGLAEETTEWSDVFWRVTDDEAGTPMAKSDVEVLIKGISHLDEETLQDYLDEVITD